MARRATHRMRTARWSWLALARLRRLAASASACRPRRCSGRPALYQIDQIEKTWHQAASTHNVNLMMTHLGAERRLQHRRADAHREGARSGSFFATRTSAFMPQNHWELRYTAVQDQDDGQRRQGNALLRVPLRRPRRPGRWCMSSVPTTTSQKDRRQVADQSSSVATTTLATSVRDRLSDRREACGTAPRNRQSARPRSSRAYRRRVRTKLARRLSRDRGAARRRRRCSVYVSSAQSNSRAGSLGTLQPACGRVSDARDRRDSDAHRARSLRRWRPEPRQVAERRPARERLERRVASTTNRSHRRFHARAARRCDTARFRPIARGVGPVLARSRAIYRQLKVRGRSDHRLGQAVARAACTR